MLGLTLVDIFFLRVELNLSLLFISDAITFSKEKITLIDAEIPHTGVILSLTSKVLATEYVAIFEMNDFNHYAP